MFVRFGLRNAIARGYCPYPLQIFIDSFFVKQKLRVLQNISSRGPNHICREKHRSVYTLRIHGTVSIQWDCTEEYKNIVVRNYSRKSYLERNVEF